MTDDARELLKAPLPSLEDLEEDLKTVIHYGLLPKKLARRHAEHRELAAALRLARVSYDGGTTEDRLLRLCELVYEAAQHLGSLSESAVALVGSPGNNGGGLQRRRSEATIAADQHEVRNWERRYYRENLLPALTSKVQELEKTYRATIAAQGIANGDPAVPAQLAIDWLARLELYNGFSEQLESLHADIMTIDFVRETNDPLTARQQHSLHVSSLFRLGYFEFLYLEFERDHHGLLLFAQPGLGEQLRERLWQLRIVARFPEHVLAWLALTANTSPFPNLWDFRKSIEESEMGRATLKRWEQLFELCHCEPYQADETCPLHIIAGHASAFVAEEKAHRLKLLGWYEQLDSSASLVENHKRTLHVVYSDAAGVDLPSVLPIDGDDNLR